MSHSESPHVLIELSEQVLTLSFNRPERKNAFSLSMYTLLAEQLVGASENSAVRVVVLKGAAEIFSSGNDLADFMANPVITAEHPAVQFMEALRGCKKPVVAVVKGIAIGIGATLLLHCDLVYATEDAQFQLPFVNFGLCPEYATSYLLPRLAGRVRANELLYLGQPFSSQEAATLGLINRTLPHNLLDEWVERVIKQLSAQPPKAIAATKQLLLKTYEDDLVKALTAEFAAFQLALNGDECKEAVAAFYQK